MNIVGNCPICGRILTQEDMDKLPDPTPELIKMSRQDLQKLAHSIMCETEGDSD